MKGLTFTVLFEAQSGNYGENSGNIATLKKMTRGDGEVYSFISRQALRYSLMDQMVWNNTPVEEVGKGNNKSVQFHPEATIEKHPEIDFFGYMKTESGTGAKTRSAVCRLSHAVSVEPYKADMDYLTNMGLSRRKEGAKNTIAQSEQHKSLYTYTVTIDLDRVGVDSHDDISLEAGERAERTKKLLDGFKFLYRDIKGRRENMSPVFIIGGVYEQKNPLFDGRVKVDRGTVSALPLESVFDLDPSIEENTVCGMVRGFFGSDIAFNTLDVSTVGQAFETLKKKVDAYYESH